MTSKKMKMGDDLNFKAVLLSWFNNKNLKNKWFWHHRDWPSFLQNKEVTENLIFIPVTLSQTITNSSLLTEARKNAYKCENQTMLVFQIQGNVSLWWVRMQVWAWWSNYWRYNLNFEWKSQLHTKSFKTNNWRNIRKSFILYLHPQESWHIGTF